MIDSVNQKEENIFSLTEGVEPMYISSDDGKEEEIPCDTVILAMGFAPNNKIYEELKDKIDIINVGDSISARKVLNATREAFDAVLNIN